MFLFRPVPLIALIPLLILNPVPALAQDNPVSQAIQWIANELNGKPQGPTRLGFDVQENRSGSRLDPRKYYLVDMRCHAKIDSKKQIADELFITKSSFVSHSVWFATTANDVTVPQNPTKLVNLLQFDTDQNNQITNYANGDCSEKFLIKGSTQSISVSFLIKDQTKLSPFGTAMFNTAKALVGLVPVFLAGPLAKSVVGDASAVGGAQDPITATISAYNASPNKVVRPFFLRSGSSPMIISSKFSEIRLIIKPVENISAQITTNSNLLDSFYDILNGLAANPLAGLTTATLSDKCAAFGTILNNRYSFTQRDASFVIGYFAQAASPGSVDGMLSCIRRKANAQDIVDNKFIYNGGDAVNPITQADIDNHYWASSRVSLNSNLAWPYMDTLTNLLGTYAQSSDPAAKVKAGKDLADWISNQTVEVLNSSRKIWTGAESG